MKKICLFLKEMFALISKIKCVSLLYVMKHRFQLITSNIFAKSLFKFSTNVKTKFKKHQNDLDDAREIIAV